MTLADEFAAIAKAAFLAGAMSETKKVANKAGKKAVRVTADTTVKAAKKVKRAVTPYQRRLGVQMKRLKRMHQKKNGDWKKGWNHSRWLKASHKATKK
jgi:Flp pilus assembly protein TadB